MNYFDNISAACSVEGLEFDDKKYQQFMRYKDLIQDWNEKINLTAITEDEQIIQKHFIDSIKAFKFPYLKDAENLLDVGTGAGLPGIPIKIMRPDMKVTLLDSLNKRILFLKEVIKELGLEDISPIHGRAEDFAREAEYREKFDVVVSRAVANMAVLSELCMPYVRVSGYFLALKGPSIDEELQQGKNAVAVLGGRIEDIVSVSIEGTELKHNIVIVKKVRETSNIYPRKAGSITKKPLK
jgi:16S rRNA (guanine527-N7)-methyltransferase